VSVFIWNLVLCKGKDRRRFSGNSPTLAPGRQTFPCCLPLMLVHNMTDYSHFASRIPAAGKPWPKAAASDHNYLQ
jgi:hypothetical protein